jgi:hypothetical protein
MFVNLSNYFLKGGLLLYDIVIIFILTVVIAFILTVVNLLSARINVAYISTNRFACMVSGISQFAPMPELSQSLSK